MQVEIDEPSRLDSVAEFGKRIYLAVRAEPAFDQQIKDTFDERQTAVLGKRSEVDVQIVRAAFADGTSIHVSNLHQTRRK